MSLQTMLLLHLRHGGDCAGTQPLLISNVSPAEAGLASITELKRRLQGPFARSTHNNVAWGAGDNL